MCMNACIPIVILLIMAHQMYLIGGYTYTPEELCEFFKKQSEPLKELCIGVQATQYLNNDGHPYSVKACLYEDKLIFLFAISYISVTSKTVDYCFTETPTALKMTWTLRRILWPHFIKSWWVRLLSLYQLPCLILSFSLDSTVRWHPDEASGKCLVELQ